MESQAIIFTDLVKLKYIIFTVSSMLCFFFLIKDDAFIYIFDNNKILIIKTFSSKFNVLINYQNLTIK